MKISKSLLLLAAFSISSTHAATLISDITTTTTAGGNLQISSITAGSVYSLFEQPTSVDVLASREYLYLEDSANPGSPANALLDSNVDTGVLNSGTVSVQFGRTLLSSETFVWLDGDSSALDPVVFSLVDSAGTVISDPLSRPGQSDGDVFSIGRVTRSEGGSIGGYKAGGWAVSIGEFTNVTGSATGIQFADSGSRILDPMMISIAAVPEPSTYALLGFGLAVVVVIGRRRRAARQ